MDAQAVAQLLRSLAEKQQQQQQANYALRQANAQQEHLFIQQGQRAQAEVGELRQAMLKQQRGFVEALKQIKEGRTGVIDVKGAGQPGKFAGN